MGPHGFSRHARTSSSSTARDAGTSFAELRGKNRIHGPGVQLCSTGSAAADGAGSGRACTAGAAVSARRSAAGTNRRYRIGRCCALRLRFSRVFPARPAAATGSRLSGAFAVVGPPTPVMPAVVPASTSRHVPEVRLSRVSWSPLQSVRCRSRRRSNEPVCRYLARDARRRAGEQLGAINGHQIYPGLSRPRLQRPVVKSIIHL